MSNLIVSVTFIISSNLHKYFFLFLSKKNCDLYYKNAGILQILQSIR